MAVKDDMLLEQAAIDTYRRQAAAIRDPHIVAVLRRGRPGDFFAPLSLAPVGKESGRAFAPFGPVPKGDACGQHKNAPACASCRGIMSSKTALSDHRACERS